MVKLYSRSDLNRYPKKEGILSIFQSTISSSHAIIYSLGIVGRLILLLRRFNFSGSLYTFLEYTLSLARPPVPLTFSRIHPIFYYSISRIGGTHLYWLSLVSTNSTTRAFKSFTLFNTLKLLKQVW